ncbi:hypothetical protein RYX36_032332 [Vicia faba]
MQIQKRIPLIMFIDFGFRYTCPLCSKSVCDMSKVWEKLDMGIPATPMPKSYQNKMFTKELSGHVDLDETLRDEEARSIYDGEEVAARIPLGTPPSLLVDDG